MFNHLRVKKRVMLTIILLTVFLLSSCTQEAAKGELEGSLEGNLKVMYWQNSVFFQKYGNLFMNKFPNVELEVINTQWLSNYPAADREQAFLDYIEERQPDVLILNESNYASTVDKGLLYRLDSVIEQDGFDVDSILPFAADWLKEQGAGSFYALAPNFSTTALYYNIDLFKKYNIELPRDRMTWTELLTLAKQFPTDGSDSDRVYGLTASSIYSFTKPSEAAFQMMTDYAATEGLYYISADGKTITIDSPQWRNIYEEIVNTFKSDSVFVPSSWNNNLFLSGQAALALEGSFYLTMISQAINQTDTSLNWGIVTAPINPQDSNASSNLHLNDIFGVNANSTNKKLAWEFVKFVNGEEVAKALSRTDDTLSVRPAFIPENNGIPLNAFYALTKGSDFYNRIKSVPTGFVEIFESIAARETDSVLSGEQTIDEALLQIKLQGNEQLQQSLELADLEKELK